MVPGIEPLYQRIADFLVQAIPEDWAQASMDVIFYPSQIVYSAEYLPKGSASPRSLATTIEAENAFRQMRELFGAAGKPLWGRARFVLESTGQFHLNWGYDDCDEKGFARFDAAKEVARMRAERKRFLGGRKEAT